MPDVLFSLVGGVGRVTLNRPSAINALSLDMLHQIEETVGGWASSGQLTSLVICGNGERGFCAGADVRQLRSLLLSDPALGVAYLRDEYRLDEMLATLPVPVSAELFGISMGGGLGLTQHAQTRVGDASTRWAMPEVGIGLWPDVGMCFHLARLPRRIGYFLAMTGRTIDGASARFAGLLTTADVSPADSPLAGDAVWIEECFDADNPLTVLERLAAHPNPAAQECGQEIRSKSPLSVAVSFEAVRRAAEHPDIAATLAQDLTLAENFLAESDFVEGVRAQLVDKDRNPRWQHRAIEDVDPATVAAYFA
ncbi:MAG: enoyl-CoA hydratase/isomerase family protein [Propionibacteriaceae bacterium]|jgi:enoyl-CoA hydratase|nr:enoyl-CoA hydratase/isomerase family protein [Propionibacteriaceae bacterium]